jgi:hypothetical protein
MPLPERDIAIQRILLLTSITLTVLTSCQSALTPSPTPTLALTTTPVSTPDVRTPASNTVEVVLSLAPGSSEASFAVRNTRGDLIFQTYGPLEDTVYA